MWLGRNKSTPIENNSGVFQGVIFSPYLFSVYISDLHASVIDQLYRYADNFVLRQSVTGTEDLMNFSNNFSWIQNCSLRSGLNLIWSKCFEYSLLPLGLLTRLIFYSFKPEPLTKVDSVKYLGVSIDENLRCSSHFRLCKKFWVTNILHKNSEVFSYLFISVFFRFPLLCPCHFCWCTIEEFQNPSSWFVVWFTYYWKNSPSNCVTYIYPLRKIYICSSFGSVRSLTKLPF